MEEVDFLDYVETHLIEIKLRIQRIENTLAINLLRAKRYEKENNELEKELKAARLQ